MAHQSGQVGVLTDEIMANAVLIPITDFDPKTAPVLGHDAQLMATLNNIDKHVKAVKRNLASIKVPTQQPHRPIPPQFQAQGVATALASLRKPARRDRPTPAHRPDDPGPRWSDLTTTECSAPAARIIEAMTRVEAYDAYSEGRKSRYAASMQQQHRDAETAQHSPVPLDEFAPRAPRRASIVSAAVQRPFVHTAARPVSRPGSAGSTPVSALSATTWGPERHNASSATEKVVKSPSVGPPAVAEPGQRNKSPERPASTGVGGTNNVVVPSRDPRRR